MSSAQKADQEYQNADKKIEQCQLVKDHIEKRTEKLFELLTRDLGEGMNPFDLLAQKIASKDEQIKTLTRENKRLMDRIIQLEWELGRGQSSVADRRQHSLSGSSKNGEGQAQALSDVADSYNNDSAFQTPKKELEYFQQVTEMHEKARQQESVFKNNFENLLLAIVKYVDQLFRKAEVNGQPIQADTAQSGQYLQIERSLYRKLSQVYIETNAIFISKGLTLQSLRQFPQSLQGSEDSNSESQSSGHSQLCSWGKLKERIQTLRQLNSVEDKDCDRNLLKEQFQMLFEDFGLLNQWKEYLQNERDSSLAKLDDIQRIVNTNPLLLNEQEPQSERKSGKNDESTQMASYIDSVDLNSTSIERGLFEKLSKIIEKLGFSQKEREIWSQYSSKGNISTVQSICNRMSEMNQDSQQKIRAISEKFTPFFIEYVQKYAIESILILEGEDSGDVAQEMRRNLQFWIEQLIGKVRPRLFEYFLEVCSSKGEGQVDSESELKMEVDRGFQNFKKQLLRNICFHSQAREISFVF